MRVFRRSAAMSLEPGFSWSTAIAVASSLAVLAMLVHPQICNVAIFANTTPNSLTMASAAQPAAAATLVSLYLETMKRTLTGVALQTPSQEKGTYDAEKRANGLDWPLYGVSMIGLKRMNNIQELLEDALAKNVPGNVSQSFPLLLVTLVAADSADYRHRSRRRVRAPKFIRSCAVTFSPPRPEQQGPPLILSPCCAKGILVRPRSPAVGGGRRCRQLFEYCTDIVSICDFMK